MALWRIPIVFGRRLFSKRRFAFGVMVTSLPFIGYLMLLTPSERFSTNSVTESSLSTNTALQDCPCATRQQTENDTAKQATAITTSTPTRMFTTERKVDHDSLMSLPGRLNVHFWSGICGTRVDILRNWPHFPFFPDKRSFITEFYKTQVRDSSNNGERIFGFVHPQTSGEYFFAIASNDTSELWLSPNEDPAYSEMIARVYSPKETAWTEEGDYKKYPDQISKEITLHAGKKYYIESLIKQGTGVAHVAVYWSYSSVNSTFKIISSEYLSSFSGNNNQEAIPPHMGKQVNISLQSRSELYDFNRLPLINRKEYIRLIPTCPYSPSFLVRQKLQRYQGVWLPERSHVFPEDDTDMFKRILRHAWSKPNPPVDRSIAESVVNKFVNTLRSG